jgi:hypothetical protein
MNFQALRFWLRQSDMAWLVPGSMPKAAKTATITIAVDKFMTPPTLLEYGDRNADPSPR